MKVWILDYDDYETSSGNRLKVFREDNPPSCDVIRLVVKAWDVARDKDLDAIVEAIRDHNVYEGFFYGIELRLVDVE